MDLIWCLVGQNFSCHFCDSKGRPQVSRLGFLEQLELTLKVRHPIWILYWKSFFSKAQEICTGNLDQACRFGYMDLVWFCLGDVIGIPGRSVRVAHKQDVEWMPTLSQVSFAHVVTSLLSLCFCFALLLPVAGPRMYFCNPSVVVPYKMLARGKVNASGQYGRACPMAHEQNTNFAKFYFGMT